MIWKSLQHCRVVMVPGHQGGCAAMGAPAFGNFARDLFGRALGQSQNAADFNLDSQISRRPDIGAAFGKQEIDFRSAEHTSELQSLMRISYAVFCLKKKKQ